MSQGRNVATDTDLKTLLYCEKQLDLFSVYQFNQQCVNTFGKDLKVTNICLYEKSPALWILLEPFSYFNSVAAMFLIYLCLCFSLARLLEHQSC